MSKTRVLIVDDAEFMRTLIRDAVENVGFEVVGEAENGQEAIEKYSNLRPDIVTIDLVMPVMSGIDGLKGILKVNPKAKVVVVSALEQRAEMMAAISAGAADFIIKPFETERIEGALKKCAA